MSHLFESGKLSFKALTDEELVKKWGDIGFLDGLDRDSRAKIAVCLEVCALMMITRSNVWDILYKLTGEELYYVNENFEIVAFPIMRRVASRIENPELHALEIFLIAEKKMNTEFAKKMCLEDESCCRYFYDKILIEGGHFERKGWKPRFKSYNEAFEYGIKNGDHRVPIDFEAEYTAYIAEEITDYFNNKK
ncbi:MAG: hypothetical protein AABY15_00330 [Nanoarchaeota archaeon]